MRRSVLDFVVYDLCTDAARELVMGCMCEAGNVLRLTGKRIGALECHLIAVALKQGLIPNTTACLWLQDNRIDAYGLRWLAHGITSLPSACGLRSLSLGQNPFEWALKRGADDYVTMAKRRGTRRHTTEVPQLARSALDLLNQSETGVEAVRSAINSLRAAAATRHIAVRLHS